MAHELSGSRQPTAVVLLGDPEPRDEWSRDAGFPGAPRQEKFGISPQPDSPIASGDPIERQVPKLSYLI